MPLWAVLAEDTVEALPCIHNAPEWTFKVGPRRFGTYKDGTGEPIHSLGNLLLNMCWARLNITWRAGKRITSIPLAHDQAVVIDADWVARCDAIMGDDDDRPEGGDHGNRDHVDV